MNNNTNIYFGDNRLIITESSDFIHNWPINNTYSAILNNPNDVAIKQLIADIESSKLKDGVIYCSNSAIIMNIIAKQFSSIEAAGGIVENEHEELLFIFRRNKWDLPKGKLELNEIPRIAAEREIEEETGVKNILYKDNIAITHHVYEAFGQKVLKTTHWFHFSCKKNQPLNPQLEEDITEIQWFDKTNLDIPLSNTFDTIKDLITIFMKQSN